VIEMPVEYLAEALGVDDARARRILVRAHTLIGSEVPAELLEEAPSAEEAPATEAATEEVGPAEDAAPAEDVAPAEEATVESTEEETPAADSSAS
jgi:hypothetical protein